MAKYTTQLVADTSQHDKALGKSKQQVYNYQKGVEKSKQELDKFTSKIQGGAVSALSKFAVGVGAGVGALESLEKIIRGSQGTSDAWDATLRVCTTTVNSFFTAISTGDFSYFTMGLDTIISKAKTAQTALDELGNAKISFSYFNSKNQAELQEQLTIAKDKSKSQSERDSAVAKAKDIIKTHKTQLTSLNSELQETLSALVTENNRLQGITVEELSNVLAIDLLPQAQKDKVKKQLTDAYKEYLAEISKIEGKHSYQGVIGTTSFGTAIYSTKVNHTLANAEIEQSGINEKYRDAILYNELLVKFSDEQLTNATNLAIEIENGNKQLSTMERQMLEITNQMVAANKVTTTSTFTKPFEKKALEMAGLPTATANEPLLDKIEPINIQIPTDTTTQLSNITSEAENAATAIGAIANAFTALGSASEEGGNKALQIFTLTASAISQLIPQIVTLISAKEAESIASGTASAAKTPYPANILAIASIVGTIAATFAQLPKFANGGIFGGANTIGDFNLARVNKGEMILNGSQQSRLFRMLNDGRVSNNSNGGGNVEFVLRGDTLIGLMKNAEKKNRRVI